MKTHCKNWHRFGNASKVINNHIIFFVDDVVRLRIVKKLHKMSVFSRNNLEIANI